MDCRSILSSPQRTTMQHVIVGSVLFRRGVVSHQLPWGHEQVNGGD